MGSYIDLDYLPAIGENDMEFSIFTIERPGRKKQVCVMFCDEEPLFYFDLEGGKDLLAALEDIISELEDQQ